MADTAISALSAISAALAAVEIPVNDAGTTKKMTLAQVILLCGVKKKELASDASANSTTTAAKITNLDLADDGTGTYNFQYYVRYQAGATTTGVKFSVNHTGTVTMFIGNMRYVDAAATASTGAPSQAANASTAQVMGAYSFRAKSATASWGPSLSVDAANSDMLMIIEGACKVSVTGTFELYHASEVAAASTVMAGSHLVLTKVA